MSPSVLFLDEPTTGIGCCYGCVCDSAPSGVGEDTVAMRPQKGSLGYVMWQKITPAWDAYGANNSDTGMLEKEDPT